MVRFSENDSLDWKKRRKIIVSKKEASKKGHSRGPLCLALYLQVESLGKVKMTITKVGLEESEIIGSLCDSS